MKSVLSIWILALVAGLLAATASAQSDVMCFCPDDDSDTECGGNLDLAAFSQRTIYLCVLDPSAGQVKAWEAYIEVVGEENMTASWTMMGEGPLNFATSPEYQVGTALNPLYPNSANLIPLLSISLTVFNENPIRFYIRPVPGSLSFPDDPGYASDVGIEHVCTICGTDPHPSFSINWAAVDESRAWGEVKALYHD